MHVQCINDNTLMQVLHYLLILHIISQPFTLFYHNCYLQPVLSINCLYITSALLAYQYFSLSCYNIISPFYRTLHLKVAGASLGSEIHRFSNSRRYEIIAGSSFIDGKFFRNSGSAVRDIESIVRRREPFWRRNVKQKTTCAGRRGMKIQSKR